MYGNIIDLSWMSDPSAIYQRNNVEVVMKELSAVDNSPLDHKDEHGEVLPSNDIFFEIKKREDRTSPVLLIAIIVVIACIILK